MRSLRPSCTGLAWNPRRWHLSPALPTPDQGQRPWLRLREWTPHSGTLERLGRAGV